jgi:hypothetical protein
MATRRVEGSRARRRRRRQRSGVLLGSVLVAAVAIGYSAYRATADRPGQQLPDQGNRHISTGTPLLEPYNSDPPTSGPHLPDLAPWGVHTRPIQRELQVHNLEDGGVLVQYNCVCPELVGKLEEIVKRYDKHVILAPYPTMKSRIALTAWTRLDTLEDVDERRITRFIDAHRGIDHHKK